MTKESQSAAATDARDLAKGAGVNALGMLAKASRGLFFLLAAHFYGAEALGVFFLAYAVTDIVAKLARFGLDRGIIHESARRGGDVHSVLGYHLVFAGVAGLVMGALLAFVGPPLAALFGAESVGAAIRLAAVGVPFLAVAEVALAAVRAERVMHWDAVVRGGVEPLLLIGCAVALIPMELGAQGLVFAQVAAYVAVAIAALFVVALRFGAAALRPRVSTDDSSRMLRFAGPLAAMDALNLFVVKTDVLLVGSFLGAAAAGMYGVALEIISAIKAVRQVFEPIVAPIVASLHHAGEAARLRENYRLATRWLLTGSLLPALLIVLGASDLLSLFAIDDGGATSALVILALAHALFGAFSASENVLVMTGHTALNAGLSAAVAVGNIVLGVLLIPRTGMTGAALATLLIYGAVVLARVGFSARFVGVHPLEWSLLFPTALAGALGALGYAVLRSVEPALLGRFVVYTVVFGLYAGSLLFFRRTVESRVAEISR